MPRGFTVFAVAGALATVAGADSWDDYWAALGRYRDGGRPAVETALGRRAPSDDVRLLRRVEGLRGEAERCSECPARSELSRLPLEAAALFHAERAFGTEGPPGREELDQAFTFVSARAALPEGREFARLWLLATVHKAHAAADGTLALRFAEAAGRLFPDDGELRLAAGTLHESLAGFSSIPPADAIDAVARARLQEAERLLAGVKEGPAWAEAHLRLGRVRLLLGRSSGRELAELVAARPAPANALLCLAHLFLGRKSERDGKWEAAAAAYAASAAACPEAQAPRLARAAVLRQSGRMAEAQREAEAALALAEERRRRDPFAAYPWGHSNEADALFARLRRRP